MTQQNTPAAGEPMTNAKGHLVPANLVSPLDRTRDTLVREIIAGATAQSKALAAFKTKTFNDIQAFVELSGEQYQVKMGGQKGNLTLHSFDGRYKVQRAVAESITFDERLQVAKQLIDVCITAWAEGARDELRVLVNDAFQVDQEGRVSVSRILSLRRLDIRDEKWLAAMQAIGDAITVTGSKTYIRIYERDDPTGQYRPINLDVAAV
jgi:hypothetical protein